MVKGSSQPPDDCQPVLPVTTLILWGNRLLWLLSSNPALRSDGKELIFFNKEDIERLVFFVGYVDVTFSDLLQRYDELIADIPHSRPTVPERAEMKRHNYFLRPSPPCFSLEPSSSLPAWMEASLDGVHARLEDKWRLQWLGQGNDSWISETSKSPSIKEGLKRRAALKAGSIQLGSKPYSYVQ